METEKVSGGHDPTCSQSFSTLPDIHELAREFPQSESDVSSTELAHELHNRPHRVNDKDSIGATPLHWACFLQKLSAVHLLLDSGADIDSATDDGWTPLHWACEIGQVGMVEVLLKRGAALNKKSLSGWTPLDCAVRNERLRVVELLLLIQGENSASANHCIGERAKDEKHGDGNVWFPKGHMVEWEHMGFRRDRIFAVIEWHSSRGCAIKALTNCHVHTTVPLQRDAAKIVDISSVMIPTTFKQACDDAAADDCIHEYCIHELVRDHHPRDKADDGQPSELGRALSKGADVNVKDGMGAAPLHWACFFQNHSAIELLLDREAEVDPTTLYGWTPLHWACERGLADVAQVLLRAGANINSTSSCGWSPLDCATHNGRSDVVELLRAAGGEGGAGYAASQFHADADSVVIHIVNPVHAARELLQMKSKLEDAAAVEDHSKIEILTGGPEGGRGVQCAGVAWAYYVDEDLLGLFLDCVNLNAVNPSDGRTALLCAATSGRIDHCTLLTEHGADINVADAKGDTALHHACRKQNLEMAKWLAEQMTSEAALGLNQSGQSALQVWGFQQHYVPGLFGAIQDEDKEAFRAHVEVIFADVL